MQQKISGKSCALLVLLSVLACAPRLLLAQPAIASDTLTLTIPAAESIFLKKNLTLLASHYDIDINKALAQQAKVWDNPVLNTDQNIYDGKFFRHTTTNGQAYGQVYVQVMQLIRTAGKIKKQTQLAEDNVSGAEAQFNDVMRHLKFTLASDMNNLAQAQRAAIVYQGEMQIMEALAKGMDEMLKTGNISQKENIRIKALLFSLQNEYNDNLQQQYDLEKEIGSLLQLKENVWVNADAGQSFSQQKIKELSIQTLQDSAGQLRPDLAFAKTQSLLQFHSIRYQKALAVPDFNVGVEYDHLNSYAPNYYGLALTAPLPLFNRNKGNIAAAELAYQQSGAAAIEIQNQVGKEVWAAWRKLLNATSMLSADNISLENNYETLMKNMVDSYRQRRVGLIEFIDFFDAYKETRIKQQLLVANQRNAAAELNYAINQNIIPL